MSRKLYFHIGPQETGAAHVQNALMNLDDSRIFKAKPEKFPVRSKAWPGNYWRKYHEDAELAYQVDFADELPDALKAHNPAGDVVLSATYLSWVLAPDYLKKFAQALKPEFDEVKIITILRRQDEMARSLVQNAKRTHGSFKAKYMGLSKGALPEMTPEIERLLNYEQRFGAWAAAFGDEAMQFLLFDANTQELFKRLGAALNMELQSPSADLILDPPKAAQYVDHILQEMDVSILKTASLKLKGAPMMPAREEARALYDKFRESNQALNAQFGISKPVAIFEEDFSYYPEEANEVLSSDEADELVRALLKQLQVVEASAQKSLNQADELDSKINQLRRNVRAMKRELKLDDQELKET